MGVFKENNMENISYIFGEQLFIGVLKYFRHGKGQITSTNWRMKHKKEFWYKYQDFYIDEFSLDEGIDFYNHNLNDLLVFRPAYVDGRRKAINVVNYQKDLHYDLALDNILGDNVIVVKEKHRGIVADGRYYIKETTFESSWEVNIYKSSGVHSHDVFQKCCDNYIQNGREAFLWGIDSFFTKSHERNLRKKSNTEDEKELEARKTKAIRHMLALIDSSTCKKLLLKYPVFQEHAPLSVLKDLIGKLDIRYPIPNEIKAENCERTLKNIIDDNRAFFYFCEAEKNRYSSLLGYDKTKPHKPNLFLYLFKYCPEDTKESLYTIVVNQINEGIQDFINRIEEKTKQEKEDILLFCTQFITEEQREYITRSLKP